MSRPPKFQYPLLQKWIAAFFVVVVAGFGFVQAVHVHDALAGQASHCSLCVVAHSAAIATPISAPQALPVESATVVQPEAQLQSRLRFPFSFIRPPPQSL
jgi:hypothetical protein